MRILEPLRSKLGAALVAQIEGKMNDSRFLKHRDECPDCLKQTLEVIWFDHGEIVARCPCGFHEQGRYTRKPAPQTPSSTG
ncbi:MAG: hypothetical protein V1853_00120 [bacterium]